jgi:hypothetical protein
VKEIPLSQGKVAVIDDKDFEKVSKYNWCYSSTIGYAVSTTKEHGGRAILMHRYILDAPSGKVTDHINRDKLDNRRSNLRLCSSAENKCNMGVRSHNKSGYKGVYWMPNRGKYQVTIRHKKTPMYLGLFDCKHEAARMYNFWAKDLFGEYASLNKIEE